MAYGDVSVIAHRGASAHAREHTWAAYDLAVRLGADRLELDVRALADGTPVVAHDRTLERTCGDPRRVSALTPAGLDALDPATRPLRLADVLERYAGEAGFLVELKDPSHADAARVAALVRDLGLHDRAVIQSFDHGALRRLAEADGALALQPLYVPAVPARWVRMDLRRVAGWACGIAAPARAVDAALTAAAHEHGLTVHAFTVNDPREMGRLLRAGVDGIITDVPGTVRHVAAGMAAAAA